MNKKITTILCLMMLSHTLMAQQKPHYTQYIMNQYIVNPALSGIENYVDIKASHRLQWVGLLDAPVTTYFTAQGPIGKEDEKTTATTLHGPLDNPRGERYWESYEVSAPHHGWGIQMINDKTGPLNNFSAMATYAYHIGLSPRTNLSAGIGIGMSNISLNADKLRFYNSTIDPAVAGSGAIDRLKLDLSAGIYLYSADYFLGLSAQQLVPSGLSFSNNVLSRLEGRVVPHFFLTAGYRFLLGENFNLVPSIMMKYVQPNPVQPELNVKLQYRDYIWVGGGLRVDDGGTVMAGINISNTFNVGYAYDYTTSRLNAFTKGTHEIMIGFTIGSRGELCPRNVW